MRHPARHGRSDSGPRRRIAGATALAALGTLAVGAGGGIGFRYLAKTGLSAGTVLGLVAFAVGLGLLARAAAVVWRTHRPWLRLAVLPAGVVVLVVGSCVLQAAMFAVAPPTRPGPATPADYGLAYTDISLHSRDGVRLSAWYVRSHNHSALVLRHGAGSTRASVLPQAAVLARHGYGVLLVDARGHGRSRGRGMDLGWFGDLDIAPAVDFLASALDVDRSRIGMLGLSMGGEEALGAAASDPRIRAVVAEGATGRTAQDKAMWLPSGAAGWLQRRLDSLTYALTDLLTPARRPLALRTAVARATETSFLLVTAGTQEDEARAAAALRAVAPRRVEVWTVPGAAHTGGLRQARDQWERRVVGFLDRRLAACSSVSDSTPSRTFRPSPLERRP